MLLPLFDVSVIFWNIVCMDGHHADHVYSSQPLMLLLAVVVYDLQT